MSSLWADLIIDCGIGAKGAKRIGEMVEKNASLKIDLFCEIPLNPLNDHYPSITV
jgi:hypothetical protein